MKTAYLLGVTMGQEIAGGKPLLGMPAWIKTKKEEAAWDRAKQIVSKQKKKDPNDFADKDWGLVTHIAKKMLKAKVADRTDLLSALANVEQLLEKRKSPKAKLSASSQVVIDKVEMIHAVTGHFLSEARRKNSVDVLPQTSASLDEVLGTLLKILPEAK